jgi:alkanesulfonate monooxygenase SsuD/methylene tetrahydromethanopterin reductase-like flavin-dependent oxidoreductase (luciferase family)
MRFDSGLLSHTGEIDNYPYVDEWLATAKLAESLGYTGVWSAEHHFAYDFGVTPTPTNPLLMGAYFASATKRIRIGQCGTLLAGHHPLRVAEDAAMLDHMSHGRMDFGIMRGLHGKVSYNFDPAPNVPRNHDATNHEVMWESFDIIKKFWSGKPFSHEGKYFKFPYPWDGSLIPEEHRSAPWYDQDGKLVAIQGLPTPFQKPIPPTWAMVSSISSHEECARKGIGAVNWGHSFEGTREVWTAYRRTAKRAATEGALPPGANLHVAMMRPTFVHESSKRAHEIMGRAINRHFEGMFGVANRRRKPMLATYEELTPEDGKLSMYDFLRKRHQPIVGSPDEVTELLKRYEKEVGCEHLIMFWPLPYISFDLHASCLKLFAEKVMPNFTVQRPEDVTKNVEFAAE